MADFLADYRQVLLALHIIAFISWMAGMLYLPRLFVYHADVEPGSVTSSTTGGAPSGARRRTRSWGARLRCATATIICTSRGVGRDRLCGSKTAPAART